jgi:glucosylceramidase
MITVGPTTGKPTEHFDFFMCGHFMKLIQRGAVRLESSEGSRLFANVPFRDPDGSLAALVVNADTQDRPVWIRCKGRTAAVCLPGRSVATFSWAPP